MKTTSSSGSYLFESPRIRFVKYTDADLEDYLALVTDLDVMRHITERALKREEGVKRYERVMAQCAAHPTLGVFRNLLRDGGTYIGLSKLALHTEHEAELGYALFPPYWGQGYASEASRALIAHARTLTFLKSLMANVDPANASSVAILKKLGFTYSEDTEIDGLEAQVFRMKLG